MDLLSYVSLPIRLAVGRNQITIYVSLVGETCFANGAAVCGAGKASPLFNWRLQ